MLVSARGSSHYQVWTNPKEITVKGQNKKTSIFGWPDKIIDKTNFLGLLHFIT